MMLIVLVINDHGGGDGVGDVGDGDECDLLVHNVMKE